jgi:glutamyl-tRNA synthetase
MGQGNKKLSKRDPESNLLMYRSKGYLPEGMTNYLALLGWALAEDRDRFSLTEMAEAFDISRVNASPARFDLQKCTALNADWIRALDEREFAARLLGYMKDERGIDVGEAQASIVRTAAPLVHERVETLDQAAEMLQFLLVDEADFEIDSDSAQKVLTAGSVEVLASSRSALAELGEWDTDASESALRGALIEGLGLKPRVAFGPVRVAVSGRRVSPPLFESLELLGQQVSLGRLERAQSVAESLVGSASDAVSTGD